MDTDEDLDKFWKETLHDIRVNDHGRKERKKTVVEQHPEFTEAAKYLEGHAFWHAIFLNCANGTYPNGISYSNFNIFHKTSKRRQTVSNTDVNMFISEVVRFMQSVGIYSPEEKKYMDAQYTESVTSAREQHKDNWSMVAKNDRARMTLFSRYVNDKYADLDKSIRDQMITLINIRYNIGVIKVSDIQYENDKITNINGIHATAKGVEYHPVLVVKGDRNASKEGGNFLVKKWSRDVKSYETYMRKKF